MLTELPDNPLVTDDSQAISRGIYFAAKDLQVITQSCISCFPRKKGEALTLLLIGLHETEEIIRMKGAEIPLHRRILRTAAGMA